MLAIIPYRDEGEGRSDGAHRILAALKAGGITTVVVEQDVRRSRLVADDHLLLPDCGPFNRSACFNAGVVRHAALARETPVYFSDADVLCSASALDDARRALDDSNLVSPYAEIMDLTRQQAAELYAGGNPILGQPRAGTNVAGGSVLMTFETWLAIGGWDEHFAGWGCEDEALVHVAERTGFSAIALPHGALHLWHARRGCAWNLYARNMGRLSRVRTMTTEDLRLDVETRRERLCGAITASEATRAARDPLVKGG